MIIVMTFCLMYTFLSVLTPFHVCLGRNFARIVSCQDNALRLIILKQSQVNYDVQQCCVVCKKV